MSIVASIKKRFKKNKDEEITGQHTIEMMSYVIGEERFFQTNLATSTGEYLVANNNKLAYDVSTDTVRKLFVSGVKYPRPHSLVFEPSSLPFNWATMEFEKIEKTDAMILNDVRMEAETYLTDKRMGEDNTNAHAKLQTTLLVVAVIFGLVCLIALKNHLAG